MTKLHEWENKNFIHSLHTPGLTVIFPSREIYFSPELLHVMRLENSTCPKTLDQWYELCHPENHSVISKLENIIYGHESELSLTRKLYCGDGFYRNFRLDAFIQRFPDGRPKKLIGNEVLALSAWLESANDGDRIECLNENGRIKVFEALRVQGVMTLNDISMIEDLQNENLRLRREIQRRVFSGGRSSVEISLPESDGSELFFANILDDNVNSALNILTGNNQLKSLRRSINDENLIIGVIGLSGSGKSTLANALIGEELIAEHIDIPVFYSEGEDRSAKIFYQDGRNELITNLPLQRGGIDFKRIARINITIPGALIPKGICIVDVPSNSNSVKNILPELDVIIYVTPIRARLKNSDYEYLKLILSINENIIFTLSQIDLEREDSEAGKVIHTVKDKIINDINTIKRDIKKFCGIETEVIPVAARTALENFYERNSQPWHNSNFENFVKYLKALSKNSFMKALSSRSERVLKIIENSKVKKSSEWKIQDIIENLRVIPHSVMMSEKISVNLQLTATPTVDSKNLLSSLITSMREREFKTRFFALNAFKGKSKAILLGADKRQSLKLYSRLAHNMRAEILPDGDITSNEWLYSGNVMPFGCIKLPLIGTDESILIAPSDSDISNNFDWEKIFRDYVPVVSVDLARIDSGLSDLAYSPYITELAFSKWVLAFGNAALFDTRQKYLVSEIPERIKEFVEANGLVTPDMFIFENYRIF